MIISKRNHLDKMEMARPLKHLIDDLVACPMDELPLKLLANLKWERPRGDLFHWVSLLNRFDEIFESQIKKYGLEETHPKLRELEKSDADLLAACLQFTLVLLDHCSNRSIYSSSDRIFSLLNVCSIDVRLHVLDVAVFLGERYLQTSSSKYSASKTVKQKVLQIARSFPPPVPAGFIQKQPELSEDVDRSFIGDHFSLLDTLASKRKYPSKWKLLLFQFYKSADTPAEKVKRPASSKEKLSHDSHKTLEEGISSFKMPEEVVRKSSLQQIYDKGSEVVPKELWFEFALAVQVAKSFNSNSKDTLALREKLIRAKCLGIAVVSCVCARDFTSSRLFESEPYIFSFLVDLIQPENSDIVSKEVYLAGMKALECVSLKRVWGTDLIRCLGGNVSHGILYLIIRHINKQVRDEDPDCYEQGYIHFFNLLGNLIDSKSLTPRLTAGGILFDLMSFLNVKTKYRWSCSAVAHLITMYLKASPESFTEFVNNNGFNLLIDTINHEVDFALENPNYGGGAPKESLVFYSISFRQANYIRNLMKLVAHLIHSESGDRLRNLFDSSILQSFNKVIQNPTVFGPLNLSATIDNVFYIIHNEPTAFSILNEANIIDTLLDNYESLFFPSSDLLMALSEVMDAVCLNNAGLKKIIDKKIIHKYFQSFYNLEFVKELVRSDMTANLGSSFDELGRHYPTLKPVILEEVKLLIENLIPHAVKNLDTIKFYTSDKGSFYNGPEDEELLTEPRMQEIENWESSSGSFILDNIFFFLGGLFQDTGQWGEAAMESIKFESFASFLTIAEAPFDYTTSNGVSSLMGVLKYFDDEKREYGLPVLFKMIKERLESTLVQEFIHSEDVSKSFFTRFHQEPEVGTKFLKELNVLNTLMYTLTEIYISPGLMFHERYHQITDLFGGYGLKVIKDLGFLLRRCIMEEILLRESLPLTVAKQSAPIFDSSTDFPPIQVFADKPTQKQEKQDGTSAKYKNAIQLRFLVYRFQNYVATVFACISRMCMQKRQDYILDLWRREATDITISLGDTLTSLVKVNIPAKYLANYTLVYANVCLYVLSLKERGKEFIHTSLLISLIQHGFLAQLKEVAVELWHRLLALDTAELEKSKDLKYISIDNSSIVKNALGQSFMLFAKVVNHESIVPLPCAKFYFHDGYEDVESELIPAVLAQTRLAALDLLRDVVGTNSRIYQTKDLQVPENIPSPLIEQLVYISKQVWLAKKELMYADFVPLNVKNVFPPIDQMNYLVSLGMSTSQAEHFFKHAHSVSAIGERKWPDCAQLDVTAQEWESYHSSVLEDEVDFTLEYPKFTPSSKLSQVRIDGSQNFANCWIKVAGLFPRCIDSIADLLPVNTTSKDTVVENFQHLLAINDRSHNLGIAVHLLAVTLKNHKTAKLNSQTFDDFSRFFVAELEGHPENVNADYFSQGFVILEQMLTYRDIPIPEPSRHDSFNLSHSSPFLMDDNLIDRAFEAILNFKNVTDKASAVGIVRILILFAKKREYSARVASSLLLRELISTSREFVGLTTNEYTTYQLAMAILLRTCFETSEFLKVAFSAELNNILKNPPRSGRRDLPTVLKESSFLVLRDPQLYVEMLAKFVRLDNYDGSKLYLTKLNLVRVKDDPLVLEEDSEDVEMSDAGSQATKTLPPSTGIVHVLLSELMEASRKDWLSSPDEPEEQAGKKVNDMAAMLKNNHFAYICFLLQALTELLGSYKQAKLEFLTFSRKHEAEKVKPRSTSLNFLLHQLIPTELLVKSSGLEYDRRSAVSSLAKLAIFALVSTPVLELDKTPDPQKEDADMAVIRRYFVDILQKILKDTSLAPVGAAVRFGKLMDLFDMLASIMSAKFRDLAGPLVSKNATKFDSYFLVRALLEKQAPAQITGLLSELDLNFPDISKVVKTGLKWLTALGKVKVDFQEHFSDSTRPDENDNDDEMVPDDDDDRDETPDLFRNLTLGMYDVDEDSEDSEDDEMGYYDEEGPLEVMLSEDELLEVDSGGLELLALDLAMEEDSDAYEEEYGDEFGQEYEGGYQEEYPDGYQEEYENDSDYERAYDTSRGDIEIIDELGGDSREGSGSSGEEGEFSDEDASEYDDDELDGWIEAFEDDDDDEDDATEETEGRIRPSRDDDGGASDDNAVSDDDSENGDTIVRSQRRDFAMSFFDALRPAMGQQGIASLFGGLFSTANDHNVVRTAVHIGEPGRHGGPRLEQAFESLLLAKPVRETDPLAAMYVKSTRERWTDAARMLYDRFRDEAAFNVVPGVVLRIEEASVDLYREKKAQQEQARAEREEKLRQQQEEEQKQVEERAQQRQAETLTLDPVMVRIGDRDVDISGTDIDPEFFEALPDDMREEVFTQHVRERRANASSTGAEAREIDPDFLDALPDQIRDEILQQESMARRFSGAGDDDASDDEEEDEDDGLEGVEDILESTRSEKRRPKRLFGPPLVDKAGVAALVRLLFIPQPLLLREHLHQTLLHLCHSKQTRTDVAGLLVGLVYDGLANKKSVDKLYMLVCQRTTARKSSKAHSPIGATLLAIGTQFLEALHFLLEHNTHMRYYLLTEHENGFVTRKSGKKGRDPGADRFQLNLLLRLLANERLVDEQALVDVLARVLQISTRPLQALATKSGHEKPPFAPPVVPEANFKAMVHILAANDCPNLTFRRTVSAMQNMSVLEGAQTTFSVELSDQATRLGHSIITDLTSLTTEIAALTHETDSKAFAKFSAPSSHQAKLLRILTALDYMFESKEKEKELKDESDAFGPSSLSVDDVEELTGLYKQLALGTLWDALSDCLRELEDRPNMVGVATVLLPLIEALMVVCKHSKVRELQIKDAVKYEAKKIDFTKEPIESLFFSFTDEHKKMLNQMVRTNPNLMSGPFGMLVRNPRVLEFDNKKSYFDRQLETSAKHDHAKLSISIRRDQVFLDSYRALFFKSKDEFRNATLEISFKGESGVDAGGVTREWYQVLSRQMFNPDYALFTPVASDETTFHPNRTSHVNPEHLLFFKFIGRIIGKAIFDGSYLDCHFSRAVYKRILGRPVSLKDMENLDLEYFKSLMWMLENDITDVITEDFSVETDDYGEHKVVDLIPGGHNIPVTESNKHEYVKAVVEYRLQTSVAEQMSNFIIGFHEIIPKDLVAIFDEQELELLISGLPDIDVNDWQNNANYNNYLPSSVQIQWFWRAVKSFDNEERAKLLQFATGTSKVPLNGFKELSGANGTCKFSIHRDYGATDRLPSSHTCFNQIDLPAYETYETLRGSLLLAITEGHEGFGLA